MAELADSPQRDDLEADIADAQDLLDHAIAVAEAEAAIVAAKEAAEALAVDGTDTQESIDAVQDLYDTAVELAEPFVSRDFTARLEAVAKVISNNAQKSLVELLQQQRRQQRA